MSTTKRYAARGEVCAFCRQPLRKGQRVRRGLTKEPYHPDCRWVSRVSARPTPSLTNSPIVLTRREVCSVCHQDDGARLFHRDGQPFHKDCLM